MKYLTMVILLLALSIPAYAATDHNKQLASLNSKALKLFRADDLDDAISVWAEAAEKVNQSNVSSSLAAEVLNNLGYAYYKKKDYEKSEEWLLASKRIKPDRWSVYLNLGDVYLKTDQPQKASVAYETLLKLNGDYKYKDKIAKKIKELNKQIELSSSHPDPFNELPERYRPIAKRYWELTNDDDWLTGIWGDVIDHAMALYTLYEKTPSGYTASYYYRRYPVTWWVGKIEKHPTSVEIWNYEIVGDRLEMPYLPTKTGSYNGKDGLTFSDPYPMKYRVTDKSEIAYLSKSDFITGENFVKAKLKAENALRNVSEYYDVIKNESNIIYGLVHSLKVIKEEVFNDEKVLLYEISFGRPAQSGYCGASSSDGYYWVHLKKANNKWAINDEWAYVKNMCRDNEVATIRKINQGGYQISNSGISGRKTKTNDCYEINSLRNFNKQSGCSN